MSPLDRTRLQEALALAESSFGLTEPNPRVGCIIGRPDGAMTSLTMAMFERELVPVF